MSPPANTDRSGRTSPSPIKPGPPPAWTTPTTVPSSSPSSAPAPSGTKSNTFTSSGKLGADPVANATDSPPTEKARQSGSTNHATRRPGTYPTKSPVEVIAGLSCPRVGGAQGRGEFSLSSARLGGWVPASVVVRAGRRSARLTGKDTNRAPGCLVVPDLGPGDNCAHVSGDGSPCVVAISGNRHPDHLGSFGIELAGEYPAGSVPLSRSKAGNGGRRRDVEEAPWVSHAVTSSDASSWCIHCGLRASREWAWPRCSGGDTASMRGWRCAMPMVGASARPPTSGTGAGPMS